MLKLTRQLFFTDPTQTRYMDYYERGLFNQILGEQDPQSAHGFVTYYTPLRPGGIKTYTNDYNNFTCDHGSALTATPGSYVTLDRTWNNGDVIDVTMPAAIALDRTPDAATVQSVRFGGIVLAGGFGTTDLTALPVLTPSSIQPTATPQQFTAQANGAQVQLIPFYKMHHQRYTVYWSTPGRRRGALAVPEPVAPASGDPG